MTVCPSALFVHSPASSFILANPALPSSLASTAFHSPSSFRASFDEASSVYAMALAARHTDRIPAAGEIIGPPRLPSALVNTLGGPARRAAVLISPLRAPR